MGYSFLRSFLPLVKSYRRGCMWGRVYPIPGFRVLISDFGFSIYDKAGWREGREGGREGEIHTPVVGRGPIVRHGMDR